MIVAPARASGAADLVRDLRDRFAPGRTRGVRGVVEIRVGGERFQLVIEDGGCDFSERPLAPTATIEIEREDLASLLEGTAGTAQLFMSQRLRVLGDMLLAVRLRDLLRGVG